MFRILVIVGFLAYAVTGILLIKNQSKLALSRPLKILLLLIYLVLLALIAYASVFIIMFGYNS
ncbi:hypothetical protein [Streptococcus thoraltensis]|uniref:hypothetical protein n=1 Tax=Streptococcus thoraltensis TaxID=55085 RepID=UPI0003655157|nr:hypothetical protein [Streptococcus thoraltensis]MDY4760692.1 hypothetical protein [Streptococcus thoraltensis]